MIQIKVWNIADTNIAHTTQYNWADIDIADMTMTKQPINGRWFQYIKNLQPILYQDFKPWSKFNYFSPGVGYDKYRKLVTYLNSLVKETEWKKINESSFFVIEFGNKQQLLLDGRNSVL